MNSVEQKINQQIIDKLGVDAELLKDGASFTDDLGADSLDVFELFTVVEKDFGINIPEDDAEKLRTVGALKKYIAHLVEHVEAD
jgi:acyl carrier protein